MYRQRQLATALHRALAGFPAVLVTGPRQSGKTTFLRHEAGARVGYLSFDDPLERGHVAIRGRTWREHHAADRPEYDIERLLFRNVRQFQRQRSAADAFGVDHLGLAYALPLGKNLPERRVFRDERDMPSLNGQPDLGRYGRHRASQGEHTERRDK